MEITVKRLTTNRLYTEGSMIVNGMEFTSTLEDTPTMLPAGIYHVTLIRQAEGPRRICFNGNSGLTRGNVWKDARPDGSIVIGEPLIPGCVVRSRAAYDRLLERIEKCKTPITLYICNDQCRPDQPISHWL